MLRRRRRLSGEGIFFLIIVALVLLVVIYPAASVLTKPQKKPDEPITIEIEKNVFIDVYHEGEIIRMPLEEYLVGVVAAEMPASYEPEAIKAQAVAARTYTMYKKDHGGCSAHPGADICTYSGHCQAYLTEDEMLSLWGNDADMYLDKIKTAVAETAGQIILYQGEEIQVFYHACSGGQTENCENVYAQALPYLVSVESKGEEEYSRFYGEVTVSAQEFVSAMTEFSPSIHIDNVQTCIGQITRSDSGRVQSIEIGSELFSGREIREIFKLNSTNFTIDVTDSVTFHTIGFGHGVGMSQTGANAMAKDGAGYEEILGHYYTGITIGTL